MYQYEAKNIDDFITRIAVHLLPRGYFYYVKGEVPNSKDPVSVAAKIVRQYNFDVSKFTSARRKRKGIARLQYVWFGHTFVILATEGTHAFFQLEAEMIRDFRRASLRVANVAIKSVGGKSRVERLRQNV